VERLDSLQGLGDYFLPEFDSQEKAQQMLLRFALEQRDEVLLRTDKLSSIGSGEEVLQWYEKSKKGILRCQQTTSYLQTELSFEEYENLQGLRVGTIFEDITEEVLTLAASDTAIILSKERTTDFLKKLYPHATCIRRPYYDREDILGISVPDFLALEIDENDKVHITAIIEATLVNEDPSSSFLERKETSKLERKYTDEYQLLKFGHQEFFLHSQFFYVVPQDFAGSEDPFKPDLKLVRMPFDYHQFGEYMEKSLYSSEQSVESDLTDSGS
jgi:hypothetical protein